MDDHSGRDRGTGTRRLTLAAVIITRHRTETCASAVGALLRQTRRPDRIIVVDASDDPLPLRASLAALTLPPSLLTLIHDRPDISGQKNTALDLLDRDEADAAADLVGFIDDDARLEPDFLDAVCRRFEADTGERIAGVAGMCMNPRPQSCASLAVRHLFLMQTGRGPYRVRLSGIPDPERVSDRDIDAECLASTAVTYRRASIRELRFDTRVTGWALGLATGRGCGEDLLFSMEAGARGRLIVAADARFEHHPSGGNRESTDVGQMLCIYALRYMSHRTVRAMTRPRSPKRLLRRGFRHWALLGLGVMSAALAAAHRDAGYLRGYLRAMRHPLPERERTSR